MKVKYEIHPIANRFPLMSDEEYRALKQDIEQSGIIREPIYLFEGKILDGRNRYRAYLEIPRNDLKVKFKELDISREEAAAFSVSENLQRRHLTKSQQAMYIVKAGLSGTGTTSGAKRRYRTGDSAIRRISERYGVSHVSIYKAIYVHKNDRGLAAEVLKGNLSVAKAEAAIRSRDKESGSGIRDSVGQKVPARLRPMFSVANNLAQAYALLSRVKKQIMGLAGKTGADVKAGFGLSIVQLASITPHAVCRKCSGRGCGTCGGKGWQSILDIEK